MAQRFLHAHKDFESLLSIVSDRRGVAVALVEKDYWVTHVLWALEAIGLEVWFKGGTSLSKGFNLIERFSEDLDVKLDGPILPAVSSWTSEGKTTTEERALFFARLETCLEVPDCRCQELSDMRDKSWRSGVYAIYYPTRHSLGLPPEVRPFVQLEVGSARVSPAEDRGLTSWVHDHLFEHARQISALVLDNRPRKVHCISPEVTVLEKIEAISRRFAQDPFQPATFVRHYEDVYRVLAEGFTPDSSHLADMKNTKAIRFWPQIDTPAFRPDINPELWDKLEGAWKSIQPLFWGSRVPLRSCAARIQELLRSLASAR